MLAHADDERLARLAVFDVVVNNADRKGGHILYTTEGQVFGVDHGVCFHVQNKLRTILWGWIGDALPAGDARGPRQDCAPSSTETWANPCTST